MRNAVINAIQLKYHTIYRFGLIHRSYKTDQFLSGDSQELILKRDHYNIYCDSVCGLFC